VWRVLHGCADGCVSARMTSMAAECEVVRCVCKVAGWVCRYAGAGGGVYG